jgi:hypothetical protein
MKCYTYVCQKCRISIEEFREVCIKGKCPEVLEDKTCFPPGLCKLCYKKDPKWSINDPIRINGKEIEIIYLSGEETSNDEDIVEDNTDSE